MPESKDGVSLEVLYPNLWSAHSEGAYAHLDQSLNPRSVTARMYDLVGQLGLNRTHLVLDVGCGRGKHVCELARRWGCRTLGLDLVISNLAEVNLVIEHGGLAGRVLPQQGSIEALPYKNAVLDLVWCRAMLVHVPNLRRGICECARVLKPGGVMVVYTTLATDRMEPREAARIYGPLGIVSRNTVRAFVEGAFGAAGLSITFSQSIGSEHMEHLEERDGRNAKELLRLARMVRAREHFVAELGEVQYQMALALYHWGTYQLLGKLSPVLYTLKLGG